MRELRDYFKQSTLQGVQRSKSQNFRGMALQKSGLIFLNSTMEQGHEGKLAFWEAIFQGIKYEYKGSGVYGVRHFHNNRDEIQLIFPGDADLKQEMEKLVKVYKSLPESKQPKARLHLSVSHNSWKNYRSQLVNGNEKDYKTIGLLPERFVTKEEFLKLFQKTIL